MSTMFSARTDEPNTARSTKDIASIYNINKQDREMFMVSIFIFLTLNWCIIYNGSFDNLMMVVNVFER